MNVANLNPSDKPSSTDRQAAASKSLVEIDQAYAQAMNNLGEILGGSFSVDAAKHVNAELGRDAGDVLQTVVADNWQLVPVCADPVTDAQSVPASVDTVRIRTAQIRDRFEIGLLFVCVTLRRLA